MLSFVFFTISSAWHYIFENNVNDMCAYYSMNHHKLNTKKSIPSLKHSSKQNEDTMIVTWDGALEHQTEPTVYLGVTSDRTLNFIEHKI